MTNLSSLAASSPITRWVVPIVIVVVATALGWIIERLAVRWARRIGGGKSRARDVAIGRALRGHLTFWGLLFGLGIDTTTVAPLLPESLRIWYPQTLLALFIVSLTLLVARLAVALVRVSAASAARPVVSLVSNVVWFVVLVIGMLLVLPLLGVNITPWLTALGIGGLAVSLALQATLTDLISGMLLLASHQVVIGNYIKLSSGEEGYITDITWRTTTVRQLSNNEIIIPNSKMTQSTLVNYHTPQMKGSVSVEVGAGYGADLERVERISVAVGQEVMNEVQGGVADFTPAVRFSQLGDYSVRFTVTLQCQEFTDQYLIKSEFIRRLYARYRAEGIEIPAPIQEVRLSETPAAHDAGSRVKASAPLPPQT